jgi:hypothetical protein
MLVSKAVGFWYSAPKAQKYTRNKYTPDSSLSESVSGRYKEYAVHGCSTTKSRPRLCSERQAAMTRRHTSSSRIPSASSSGAQGSSRERRRDTLAVVRAML